MLKGSHYCSSCKCFVPLAPGFRTMSRVGAFTVGVAHVERGTWWGGTPCPVYKRYLPREQLKNLEEMDL